MPIFIDKDKILLSNNKSDIEFANRCNMKFEINKEDASWEEVTINGIISSCENILDDLEQGAIISKIDMEDLIHADNIILDIQQRISKE